MSDLVQNLIRLHSDNSFHLNSENKVATQKLLLKVAQSELRADAAGKVAESIDAQVEQDRIQRKQRDKKLKLQPELFDPKYIEKKEMEEIQALHVEELLNFTPKTQELNHKIHMKQHMTV